MQISFHNKPVYRPALPATFAKIKAMKFNSDLQGFPLDGVERINHNSCKVKNKTESFHRKDESGLHRGSQKLHTTCIIVIAHTLASHFY